MTLHANLDNKVALVTGASSGLGDHFARLLARSGAAVVVTARRMQALEKLVAEIEADGGRAFALRLDVTDAVSVHAAVAQAIAKYGAIDILVNNSGTTSASSFLDQSEDMWDSVLDTNLKGAFLVAREVALSMRDSARGGSIINISSILGLRQAGQVASYAVSKAGLLQLTKTMALELARYGIRVNAMAPGYIETDLNRDFWSTAQGAAMLKRIPQRRLGKPEELDGVLLLLASDASRYMTGSVIAIDGGHLVSTL
jgi:NAD(P)-dependent dehydrogenase (short-subunit alcohol dehydrogenase family)